MTKPARFLVICVDCMQEIRPARAPAIFAYFDSRLRSWVCPGCWQERKRREQQRETCTLDGPVVCPQRN